MTFVLNYSEIKFEKPKTIKHLGGRRGSMKGRKKERFFKKDMKDSEGFGNCF